MDPFRNDEQEFDYFDYTDSQLPESPPVECEEIDVAMLEEPKQEIKRCDEKFELLLPCNGGLDPRFSKTAQDRLVVLDTCSPHDYGEDLIGELDWQTQVRESQEETPRRLNDSEWDHYYMEQNAEKKKGPSDQPTYGRPRNCLDGPNRDTIL